MRINDISISRSHAVIRKVGEELYLMDLNSKFGTLVARSRPLKVDPGRLVAVQAGRTVMTFVVQADLFSCCGK